MVERRCEEAVASHLEEEEDLEYGAAEAVRLWVVECNEAVEE